MAINQLFKENRFCKGEFFGLGRKLNMKNIVCPTFLLAGESDDITAKELTPKSTSERQKTKLPR